MFTKGSKDTAAPPWYTQTKEALEGAKRAYNPELAMQAVAVMDWLPDLAEDIARFYSALGAKSVAMVELPPSTVQFFSELGSQQQRQAGALRTAMAAAKKSVQDRIERIKAQRQKDAAWDVSKHASARY
jgi:hypothetical protein